MMLDYFKLFSDHIDKAKEELEANSKRIIVPTDPEKFARLCVKILKNDFAFIVAEGWAEIDGKMETAHRYDLCLIENDADREKIRFLMTNEKERDKYLKGKQPFLVILHKDGYEATKEELTVEFSRVMKLFNAYLGTAASILLDRKEFMTYLAAMKKADRIIDKELEHISPPTIH